MTTALPTLKEQANKANANSLASILQALGLGDILRGLITKLQKQVPVTGARSNYNLTTVQIIALPDDAKCEQVISGFARATGASGTLGNLTPVQPGVTPADAQIAATPNGDIAVLASAAYTLVDVQYVPKKEKIVELTLPVVSHVATLPAALTTAPCAVFSLLEAESLAGTLTGKLIVLVPSASAPATTKAVLNMTKDSVLFATADAVTSCRVKVGVSPDFDVNALLEAASTIL